MDREMIWNTEVTKIQHTNYVRNSRAITVAWFVFCACYTILNIVAFIQPFWFGDTNESPGVGYFGLYEWCERVQGSDYSCSGDFLDYNTILNNYFRASSFLVGCAALLFIISIICMLLFLFLRPERVLRVCGLLQLIAAVFMAVACIILPNAFDDDNVKRICGGESQAYNMDKCQIRWAYILAIVLIFDALILSVLAFVLAARQAKAIPEFEKKQPGTAYVNNGYSGSLKTSRITIPSARGTTPTARASTAPSSAVHSVRQRHSYRPLESDTPQIAGFSQPHVIPVENFDEDNYNQPKPVVPKLDTNFTVPDSPASEPRQSANMEPVAIDSNRSSMDSLPKQDNSPRPSSPSEYSEKQGGAASSSQSGSIKFDNLEDLSPGTDTSAHDVIPFDTPRDDDSDEEVDIHF